MPQLLSALNRNTTDKSAICLALLTTHLERHYLKSSLLHVPSTIILTFKDVALAAGSFIPLQQCSDDDEQFDLHFFRAIYVVMAAKIKR